MNDSYVNKIIHTSNPIESKPSVIIPNRTIYYGKVVSIDDNTDGMRIKVFIQELDKNIGEGNVDNLPWCYPLMPKFFHVYPIVGEIVRIFLEDNNYNQKGRFWLGSVISQPHKISYDSSVTALSTIDRQASLSPEPAPSTYPDAQGVYLSKNDVGIVGRVNTDLVLKENYVLIRSGKHENNNPLKLNTKNPSTISLVFEPSLDDQKKYISSNLIQADRIALISHSGNPQFKTNGLNGEDRENLFKTAHPLGRGDVIVEALNVIRNALLQHIHGYSGVEAEKTDIINKLENLDFSKILQKNIVIN